MHRDLLWFWQITEDRLPSFEPTAFGGVPWPKISIVTPSYNQGPFIEDTIRSVILQGYPNLEYIIIDGGSTDHTVDIVKKYEKNLTYWVSEKDNGQTEAINKGFQKATGDILAYLNSDDIYMPYTFRLVAETFIRFGEVRWLTGFKTHLHAGYVISPSTNATYLFDQKLFRKGYHILPLLGWNQQPSTFWRKELFQMAGQGFNEAIDGNMDINLWIRFSDYAQLYFLGATIGLMRKHPGQKSQNIDNSWELFERQQEYLRLHPLWWRKLIKRLYQVPFLRFFLKRLFYNPTGRMIIWDYLKNDWIIVKKSIF